MALKKYAARKNTFSCGIFCVCEGKINFLPRSPRPMVPAEAFPVPLFFCRTIIPCRDPFADGGLFFTGIIEVKSYPFSKIIDTFPDDQWKVAFRMC